MAVRFVNNLPYNFLDNVLNGDQTSSTAVLIHQDSHLLMGRLHLPQQRHQVL